MTYSKNTILAITVLLLSMQSVFAFYHTKWEEICGSSSSGKACKSEGINQVRMDLDSVNIHNDSIYYAVQYFKNTGGKVSIIQFKNNKAGIVKTYDSYEYEHKYMQNHVEHSHPAYTEQQATNFKDIDKNSFIYETIDLAKKVVEVKKAQPSYLGLFNGLYEY